MEIILSVPLLEKLTFMLYVYVTVTISFHCQQLTIKQAFVQQEIPYIKIYIHTEIVYKCKDACVLHFSHFKITVVLLTK